MKQLTISLYNIITTKGHNIDIVDDTTHHQVVNTNSIFFTQYYYINDDYKSNEKHL